MNSINRYEYKECVKLFLHHLDRQEYSIETIDGYGKDLKYFGSFLNDLIAGKDICMKEVDKQMLLEFMDESKRRGHRANTVGRRMSTLKSFYKFLVYELDYPVDEAARIRVPKVYVPLRDILSVKEVERLLRSAEALSLRYGLFFSALYYTGSRLSPIRTLKWQHIDLEEQLIYFPKVKGGRDHYLPVHPKLIDLFTRYSAECVANANDFVFASERKPEQPVSASHIRNILRKAAEQAGLQQHITPHTLRHCTATHLTIQNVPQTKIASILAHTDLRSTMRYQHLAVEHLRGAVDLL